MPDKPLDHTSENKDLYQALLNVQQTLAAQGFDRKLHHLLQLRASQINRCGFCIDMHTREARADGETNDRLDRVVAFEQFEHFSPREKAALAWTEALTEMDPKTDWTALRSRVRAHFNDKEMGVLTIAAAMINLWNRIQVSQH